MLFKWPFGKTKNLNQKSSSYVNRNESFYRNNYSDQFYNYLLSGNIRISNKAAYEHYDKTAPLADAVNRISDSIAALKPLFVNVNGEVVQNEKMNVLKNPGFGQTYEQFIKDYAISYLLTRNTYLITDPNQVTIRTPKPFYVQNITTSSDGFVSEYRVNKQNGVGQQTFKRRKNFIYVDDRGQTLTHIKGQTNNWGTEGRSPLEPIYIEIGQRVSGGNHNLGVLKNGARTSLAFIYNGEQELTEEQYTRLKENIDGEYGGDTNAGRPMLLDGNYTLQDMAKSNKDMDYATVVKVATETIYNGYKIPLALVTSERQTFNNYNTAVTAYYDDAVFNVAKVLFSGLSTALNVEDGVFLEFDESAIPAIRNRRLEETKLQHDLGIFSDNELRVALNHEPYPGGDEIYKPQNLVPIGQDDGALDEGKIEAFEEESEKSIKENLKKLGLTEKEIDQEWLLIKH